MIWENIAANIELEKIEIILAQTIRLFLSVFALWIIISALQQRELYYYYIATGNISIIIFSSISVFVQMSLGTILFQINSWGWMMFGYFFDVVFFSAAIGYRLKEESTERMLALQKVIDQQNEIKKLEIEKLQADYTAREQERNRISCELHDDLGGGLSTIRLMTEMIKDPQFGLNGTYLDNISSKSKELIQNMNEIVWSLNTTNDNIAGMIVYIRQYAGTFLDDAKINLHFNQPANIPSIEVDGHTRRHIFLLVKEAMHNIVKHAGADEVEISITVEDHFIITIADNGKGINNAQKEISGNGLRNMQQRIDALKGTMQILNQQGTTLIFSIPLSSLYNKSVS